MSGYGSRMSPGVTSCSLALGNATLGAVSIRVLWLTKGLGPGGAERLLVEMAGRIDHDRFDVTAAYVLPWKDHLAGELEANGVRTVCLSRRDPDPWWPLRLGDVMARFDIVHAHSPVPAAVARVASRTMRRDVRPITMSTEHNTWTSHHAVTRWADRLTGRLDEATFAVTQEVIDSMSGAPADRAEVLTHGIDVAAHDVAFLETDAPGDTPLARHVAGQRAYYATRILLQSGFRATNISGGMLARAHAVNFWVE